MPRKRKTLADKARALHAAEPGLTVVEIQKRIGAKTHQQVQSALADDPNNAPGRKKRVVRVEFGDPGDLALVTALAKHDGKTVEDWIARVAVREAENRRGEIASPLVHLARRPG